MAELLRYAAFISYSSKDAWFARRLHHVLESYGIPAALGPVDLIGGGKKNRIYPVFRDREELSAGQLGEQIEANLRASAALIVVCSPHAAASRWVQKEIEYFAGLGRLNKIFAIIADTAPLVDANGADCTFTCFPPAFTGDALAGDKLEPLAADASAAGVWGTGGGRCAGWRWRVFDFRPTLPRRRTFGLCRCFKRLRAMEFGAVQRFQAVCGWIGRCCNPA